MLIIETSIFTRQCRKVRWMSAHAGKRGGIRVIYYWMSRADRILMLMAYPKSAREDLTPWQVQVPGKLVKQELQGAEDG